MYKIKLYEDKNGKSEIYDYIQHLKSNNDKDSRIKLNKIILYVNMLKQYGFSLGEPYIKKDK